MKRRLSRSLPIFLALVMGAVVVVVSLVDINLHGTGLFKKGWKEILPAEDRGEISMPVNLLNSEPVVRNWQGEFYAFGIYCGDAYCWGHLWFNPNQNCYQVSADPSPIPVEQVNPYPTCISVEQAPLAACDTSLIALREFNHPPQGLMGCLVAEYTYAGKRGITIVGQDQNGGIWMWEHTAIDTNLFVLLKIFGSALLAGLLGWLVGRISLTVKVRK